MRVAYGLVLLLAGCGGSGVSSGGCDTQPINQSCIEYQGATEVVATYSRNCGAGTWSASGCSATNRVGGCSKTDGSTMLTYITWFYKPNNSEITVRQGCTDGTFVK